MIRNQEWLDKNQYRTYPIKENASCVFFNGTAEYILPNNIFLDMQLTLSKSLYEYYSEDNYEGFEQTYNTYRITKLEVYAPTVVIYIEDVAYFTANFITEQQVVYSDVGSCVVQNITQLPSGTWTSSNCYLEPRVIKNNPFARVTSVNNLTGDVMLTEGHNIKIETEGNTIIITAGLGYGQGEYCGDTCIEPSDCDDALYGINGMLPDSTGNLLLIPEKMITIDPITNGLEIGSEIASDNLCEREGGVQGNIGPKGPSGGAGVRGGSAEPIYCINRYCQKAVPIKDVPEQVIPEHEFCCKDDPGDMIDITPNAKNPSDGTKVTDNAVGVKT